MLLFPSGKNCNACWGRVSSDVTERRAAKAERQRLLRAQAPGRATLVVTNDHLFAAGVADRVVSTAPQRKLAVA